MGLMTVRNPLVITSEPLDYEFEQLENLASNGLYTSETILKYQKILTSPLEEKIISTRITDAITGKYALPDGVSLGNALSMGDFTMIESKISSWSKAISTASKEIGGWFGFILFSVFIIKLFISLVNSLVNFKFLKQSHGCLIALFFCIFDTITHFILSGHLLQSKKPNKSDIEDQQESSILMKEIGGTGG